LESSILGPFAAVQSFRASDAVLFRARLNRFRPLVLSRFKRLFLPLLLNLALLQIPDNGCEYLPSVWRNGGLLVVGRSRGCVALRLRVLHTHAAGPTPDGTDDTDCIGNEEVRAARVGLIHCPTGIHCPTALDSGSGCRKSFGHNNLRHPFPSTVPVSKGQGGGNRIG
jgi:hypothetical protein